jgi:pyrimidine-nucleoside phosphorylase
MKQVIEKKKQGQKLTQQEIEDLISAYHKSADGDSWVEDFLYAVRDHGLDVDETTWLTEAIANTGSRIDWKGTNVAGKTMVDVPSTGGVGNKSPLIVPPIITAAGLIVPKMSSRGSVAGTIDILESIGYKADFSISEFIETVKTIGLSNICQTEELAPVDDKLMALRRKTGTMRQASLVVSSVLSKKLATGCNNLVIDVKAGEESKFGDYDQTLDGARLFVEVGKRLGLKVVCVVTDNDNPQGTHIGRSLSLIEVIEVLQGRGPTDQREICYFLAAQALLLGGVANSYQEAEEKVQQIISSCTAFKKFLAQLEAHRADLTRINDPALLQDANYKEHLVSDASGYITRISAKQVDECAKRLLKDGGSTPVYNTGVVLSKQVGDYVNCGDVLAVIHANDREAIEDGKQVLSKAFHISQSQPPRKPFILALVSESGLSRFWNP